MNKSGSSLDEMTDFNGVLTPFVVVANKYNLLSFVKSTAQWFQKVFFYNSETFEPVGIFVNILYRSETTPF